MDFFVNFLNKFNASVGKYFKDFKFQIPYPKTLVQKIKAFFSALWQPILAKIHRFVSEEKYATNLFEDLIHKIFNAFTLSLLIIGSFVGFVIYKLDQKAFFQETFNLKKLENLLALRKPAFTEFDEREFYVPDVFVPVIIKNRPDITRVYLDIKLRASNKLIKLFFVENNWVNTDLLVDRLLTTLGPIIATFPLTDEGKKILKNKIKFECDQLLKDLKIEGNIEEVIIQGIFAA
jgi:hypothetical protein